MILKPGDTVLVEATVVSVFNGYANDAKNNGGPGQQARKSPQLGAVVGGALNPPWVEWLMGWPIGWTDLKPLGMGKFRSWLQLLSVSLNEFLKEG